MVDTGVEVQFPYPAALIEARRELAALLADLPETRLYRATEREGWTLKHHLSALAASDAELVHLIDHLRAALALGTRPAPLHLRRFRGQAMLAAQELRLAPLREHLDASAQRTAEALQTAADLLDAPLTIESRDARCLADCVADHEAHALEALRVVREVLGR
ncbi:MAG: hypothetical protein GEU80_09805 [Dehalococcoidia bacterium]|nr:hypothetical protein [Dehalococcoidia bacterium]